MLKKMTTIGLALGLLLPGSALLAQTTQEQAEVRTRTETQERIHAGSQAAGDQERIQEQTRTRSEQQARDQSGEMKKQQKGKDPGAAGDMTRSRDRDSVHQGGGTQSRRGGR